MTIKYKVIDAKDIKESTIIALQKENKEAVLVDEETIAEVTALSMFEVISVHQNKRTNTVTVELLAANDVEPRAMLFGADVRVYSITIDRDEPAQTVAPVEVEPMEVKPEHEEYSPEHAEAEPIKAKKTIKG